MLSLQCIRSEYQSLQLMVMLCLFCQVTITPEVTSRGVNRAIMKKLVDMHRKSQLGNRLPAYDGRKSLFTAGALPFTFKEFAIQLVDEDDGQGGPRLSVCK